MNARCATASALSASATSGLTALCETHVDEQREIGRQIEALIASSPELHERFAYKRATTAAALEDALVRRIGEPRLSGVLADLGIRAYYDGFSQWIHAADNEPLAAIVNTELDAILTTASSSIAKGDGRTAAASAGRRGRAGPGRRQL